MKRTFIYPLFIITITLLLVSIGCKKEEKPMVPTVTTSEISSITASTASSGGIVTDDGGATVITRGVCWSTGLTPTIEDNLTTDGAGAGSFTSKISGLNSITRYYVRAYATNGSGIGYGIVMSFTTLGQATVSTNIITGITSSTAICGGNITSDGGVEIISRGVCWSTSPNPTTSDSKTTEGSGTGTFSSNILGLDPNKIYHVRAYAINSIGTSYGSDIEFKTIASIPTLTTSAISEITTASAVCGGNITYDGEAAITSRGVCWSTSPNPTTSDSKTTEGYGIGTFTANIVGLDATTTYYVRAYATNSAGTGYGDQVSFSTTGILTDIDGNNYMTIKIGTQIWMAENLKTTKYNDGTNIPLKTDNTDWNYLNATPGYCWYNNNEAIYKNLYGALYNWYTINTGRLCPNGWHVSSDTDWTTLTDFIGGESGGAGCALKEAGIVHWQSPNYCATNNRGFTALPGGLRDGAGTFKDIGILGFWWSSTEYVSNLSAWFRTMYYADKMVTRRNDFHVSIGLSVRCVKD